MILAAASPSTDFFPSDGLDVLRLVMLVMAALLAVTLDRVMRGGIR